MQLLLYCFGTMDGAVCLFFCGNFETETLCCCYLAFQKLWHGQIIFLYLMEKIAPRQLLHPCAGPGC